MGWFGDDEEKKNKWKAASTGNRVNGGWLKFIFNCSTDRRGRGDASSILSSGTGSLLVPYVRSPARPLGVGIALKLRDVMWRWFWWG